MWIISWYWFLAYSPGKSRSVFSAYELSLYSSKITYFCRSIQGEIWGKFTESQENTEDSWKHERRPAPKQGRDPG